MGLIGDFREEAPTARQWQAALDLCVDLCLMLALQPDAVVGHGELPRAHGGHKAPGEPGACPGDRLVMSVFREEVRAEMARRMAQDARWRLEGLRVRLP